MRKAYKRGNKIGLKFGGGDFKSVLSYVKGISGRKFDPITREWLVDNTDEMVRELLDNGFDMDFELTKDNLPEPDMNWKKEKVPKKYNYLYPFQKETFKFTKYHGGRAIMGLDMGCISGDAMVTVRDDYKEYEITLKELHDNKWRYKDILSWDEVNHEPFWNKIKAVYFMGYKGCKEIVCASYKYTTEGEFATHLQEHVDKCYKLRLTPDHEVLDYRNNWVRTDSLSPRYNDKPYIKTVDGNMEVHSVYGVTDLVPVYDVVVMDPFRNFIANGIVVHNCGKTLTSLSYLDSEKDHYPALIIVPSPLKLNWVKEYKKFVKDKKKIKILYGTESVNNYHGNYDIVVVNYELLSLNIEKKEVNYQRNGETKKKTVYSANKNLKDFIENNFQMVIIDEVQRIANEKSKVYNAIKKVCKKAPHILGLSGTPMNNKPKDLFNILNILRPDLFPNRYEFLNKFCDPQVIQMGKRKFTKYDGLSNAPVLHNILQEVMIRFMKKDVLKDLPPLTKSVISAKLRSDEEYQDHKQRLFTEVEDPDNGTMILEVMEKLKQLSYELKKDECFDFIDTRLEVKDKVIVFANHTKVLDDILERYGDQALKYDGKISSTEKEENKLRFINDPNIKILALNIKAGGEGVDGLQEVCDTVIFLEFPWHNSALQQAIDRLWRNKQKSVVNAYLLVGENTIDEEIIELIDDKRDMFDQVVDGKSTSKGDLLTSMLSKYKAEIRKMKEKNDD